MTALRPNHRKPGAVLSTVKAATRRLRRWPAASLDRACARRHGQSSGRDEGMLTSVEQRDDAVRQPNQPLTLPSTSSQGAPKQL